jgi:hypothetical protein
MNDKKKRKELPPIPLSEWLILAAGILIFAATEGILFLKGFTNLFLNSIAALLLAAGINYAVFGVQNKLKLISKAFASLLAALPLIPVALVAVLVLALRSALLIVINFLYALPKLLPAIAYWLGIALLNIIAIPFFAVYLTIYGMIFSLSGSMAKIMLRHYDAFGHKLIAPVEKYLNLDMIYIIIALGVAVGVGILISNLFQTASSITAADSVAAASGNALNAFALVVSYVPVFVFVIAILLLAVLYWFFRTGAEAFAM